MAFEWVAGLFQSEQTRGLSGDSAHTVALDDANPYYNYRLRRHKAEGDVVENPALFWYTSPYVKRRSGLGTHVSAEVGEGVANYTDVLLVLSEEDHGRISDTWSEEMVRVLQQEFETYCRREGFSRLHAHRQLNFRVLCDGSEEIGGLRLGLNAGDFVTGLLPNLYTGPVRGSFPVIGVNVNLPGVWEGYQEVGRLHNDQILFTLGNHWLDNFRHPSLEQAALYRLRQYPDGSFVHIINPDMQDAYQVTTANQGGASVLTLATRAGKPLAYIVLAVIDPPSTRPSTGAAPAPALRRPSQPPSSSKPPPIPSIAPPMVFDEEDATEINKVSKRDLGGKTIVPDAPSERIFTLQERGAMLQKVHFSAYILGYDVYLGRRGELGTHVAEPAATFQVRKRSVSLVAHIEGVKVGGRPVPTDVEVPIEGDMGIEFAGQRFEYRDLRWLKVEGWPYVGEIRRPASSTYMIWGEEYRIGRSRECRVVLPDEPRNDNIHWKPSMGDGATVRTRTKEIPKSQFYTDSIMVASDHASVDLTKERPEVICTARHCHIYVRRGESVEPLFPSDSGLQPQASTLEPGDEVLIGNCLFHVGFTPASAAAATAPAPKVELQSIPEFTSSDLARGVEADLEALDQGTPAPAERRLDVSSPSPAPSIAPPAMLDDEPDIAPPMMLDSVVPAMEPDADENDAATGSLASQSGKPKISVPPAGDTPAPSPPLEARPLSPADLPENEPPPLPVAVGPDSIIDQAMEEKVEDEPTTPGMVVPPDAVGGPSFEVSDAISHTDPDVDATADEPRQDVGGWDQEGWDSVPKGLSGDDAQDDTTPALGAARAVADDEGMAAPSSVPTPFPEVTSADTPPGAPEPEELEETEQPDSLAAFATAQTVELPQSIAPSMATLSAPDEAPNETPEAVLVSSEPEPEPEPEQEKEPEQEQEPAPEPEPTAEPVVAGAGRVVFMDDSQAQFELGRPLHIVQSGWMINGEVVAGNHEGADLVLPENRIVEDQVFVARNYFRLKVRGRRGTYTILDPNELLVDEADPSEGVYDDAEKHIVDVIRRDDTGEEDFAVRLQLRQDKSLPDPRARLLALDVEDPLAAALVTRGVPKGATHAVELSGLAMTLLFDGNTVTVSDYLESYRDGDGFRPFFVQRGDHRFVTAPEDGSSFVLEGGDRLVVGLSVFVLRKE